MTHPNELSQISLCLMRLLKIQVWDSKYALLTDDADTHIKADNIWCEACAHTGTTGLLLKNIKFSMSVCMFFYGQQPVLLVNCI